MRVPATKGKRGPTHKLAVPNKTSVSIKRYAASKHRLQIYNHTAESKKGKLKALVSFQASLYHQSDKPAKAVAYIADTGR